MTKSSQDCLVVPHNSCHIGTLPHQLLLSGNSKKNSVLLLLFSSLFKNPHTHSHFLTHLPTHPKSRSKKRRYIFFSTPYRVFRNSPKQPWPARISMRRRLSGSDNSLSLSVKDRLRRLGSRLAESRSRSAPRLTAKNSSKPL